MSENCEERFLFVLNEAKTLFDTKSKEGQEVKIENEELHKKIEQLQTDKKELISKQESLMNNMRVLEDNVKTSQSDLEKATDQLRKSKRFMKNFFTELLNRVTEVDKKGVYNADTVSYLIGDVCRSLTNTSFVEKQNKSPSKKQGTHKLSTNKEKKRSRYKNIAPLDLHKKSTSSLTGDTIENASTFNYQDANKNHKKVKPLEKKSEENAVININNGENKNFLDPNLTLCSPIGPPSRASTPQEPCSEKEQKTVEISDTTAVDCQEMSPSLLAELDMEDLKSSLLPHLLSLDGEIPEIQTAQQSPTIPSRSHSTSKNNDLCLEARKSKRKRNLDMTFGSLLEEPQSRDVNADLAKTKANESTRSSGHCVVVAEKCKKNQDATVQDAVISPDIIVLEDSDFVKPKTASIPRKKPKTCPTVSDTSILLFSSPRRTETPVTSSGSSRVHENSDRQQERKDAIENESQDDDKPTIAFHLNFNESSVEEKPCGREEKCEAAEAYKYTEVVRGKDQRAKLNGYFCADCEKYYGSLKLSEEEFQERLKACSRHRARFSPPPSTPEHFWQVDFMDTHEYIERGFMRSESDLPAREKKKLRGRRTKGK